MKGSSIRRLAMAGLTLVELMISLTIGLIIVLATLAAYVGSSSAARITDAQMRMNEDAQAALGILSQQLRMAGANPKQPRRVESTQRNPIYKPSALATSFALTDYALRGCSRTFNLLLSAPDIDGLSCPAPTGTPPHSIAVSYEADIYNTVVSPGGSTPTDCNGGALTTQTANLTVVNSALTGTETAAVDYFVAENRFFISTVPAIGAPSLFCKGNGGDRAQRSLVENIEDLQLTYGVVPAAAPSTSGRIAGYMSAEELATALPSLTDAQRWSRVVAVRVCVVARSVQAVAPDMASARYTRCDSTVENNPPDLRLRRAYSTIVTLRNRS